jgi:O-methyltransferase
MAPEPSTTAETRAIRAVGPGAAADALAAAYLELLKLALCDLVGPTTRTVTTTGDGRLFSRELTGDQVEWRVGGQDWPQNALTMVGLRRLDDLERCVHEIVRDGVPGDLVEAGAWRGGASILMRATLDVLGARDRTVYVADSFQGFPLPDPDGDVEDRGLDRDLSAHGYLAASLEDVHATFTRLGLADGVTFVPGFFEETLAALHGHSWALVRIDGDTYGATRVALDALYPGLSVGGYVTVDDYFHPYVPMCRRAVDDFRAERGVTEPIEQVDFTGARWRRERAEDRAAPAPAEPPRPPRAAAPRPSEPIPTDRELQLDDEVTALRARLAAAEAELERLRGSPLAGPSAWLRARRAGQR